MKIQVQGSGFGPHCSPWGPHVATASVAYLKDLQNNVRKAMAFHGPRYVRIDTPCPSVWGFPSNKTLEVGRLGVNRAGSSGH